jgi:hypothetical protein
MGKIRKPFKLGAGGKRAFGPIVARRLALSSLLPLSSCSAMIWYVNAKKGSDASDGRSMETAFRTLGHAIAAASAGDGIVIAPGAYDPDLPQKVSAARAAGLTVSVAGSE